MEEDKYQRRIGAHEEQQRFNGMLDRRLTDDELRRRIEAAFDRLMYRRFLPIIAVVMFLVQMFSAWVRGDFS